MPMNDRVKMKYLTVLDIINELIEDKEFENVDHIFRLLYITYLCDRYHYDIYGKSITGLEFVKDPVCHVFSMEIIYMDITDNISYVTLDNYECETIMSVTNMYMSMNLDMVASKIVNDPLYKNTGIGSVIKY